MGNIYSIFRNTGEAATNAKYVTGNVSEILNFINCKISNATRLTTHTLGFGGFAWGVVDVQAAIKHKSKTRLIISCVGACSDLYTFASGNATMLVPVSVGCKIYVARIVAGALLPLNI
jgi:hypothetical protein